MSPRLEANSPILGERGRHKFVRLNENVEYGSIDAQHIDISSEFNVDDAGILFTTRENILVSGDTTSCRIQGNEQKQRGKTCRLIESITGFDCESV